MPTYVVTDPQTGKKVKLTGETPPTEQELTQVFARLSPATEPAPEQPSALRRYASGVGEMLNPVTMVKGVAQAVRHPIETASAIVDAQKGQFSKAKENFTQGRYSEAVGHGAAGLLPVVGPMAADIGEQIGSGDVAGGAGRATGLLAPFAVKPVVGAVRAKVPTRAGPAPLTPAQEAVRFAQERGIPMTAGQATRNPVLRGVEQVNARTSPIAAAVTSRARDAQASALTRVGNEIADTIVKSPVTPEQAGEGIRGAVAGAVRTAGSEADTAYGRLRQLEAQDASRITQTGGVQAPPQSARPFTDVPLAVDVASTKRALDPMYQRLLRESELVPLQGGKARALTALDRLMRGPDTAPLSEVDAALGDLKAMARADIPELRTQGQGVAANAVQHLETQVRATAQRAGPDVLRSLMDGRKATIAKYAAADLLDTIRTEPVQAFKQATYAKDAGISHLRELARIAPNELRKIGRAYVEDLLDTATAEGGFAKTGTIASKWEALGPQTKSLLYSPQHVKDLDNFFRFAKSAAENVNPSGSGFTAALTASGLFKVMNPTTGVPLEVGQAALAKLLGSPTTVRLVTRSLRTPARSSQGAQLAKDLISATAPLATATAEGLPRAKPQPQLQP